MKACMHELLWNPPKEYDASEEFHENALPLGKSEAKSRAPHSLRPVSLIRNTTRADAHGVLQAEKTKA